MNARPTLLNRRQLAWPLAGLLIGISAAINPFYAPHIAIGFGIIVWCLNMTLVLILSGHPIGARIGVLIAGFCLAVPCFVWAMPLPRGLLMCFMGLPFAAATALVLAPPITSFRTRLNYISSWCGKRQIMSRGRNFDAASLFQLILATLVLAAAIAVVKSVSNHGYWVFVRWLAGGILVFAFAEMATACHNFLNALLGLTVPAFWQSPYRSTTVGEFWTKRWNPPASELFREICFMPLARHGAWLALSAAFLVSGIAHVLLAYMAIGRWGISIICGCFFFVQPILIAAERWLSVRHWQPLAARVWTLTALAITSPLFVEPALQIVQSSWGTPENILIPTIVVLGAVIVFSGFISLSAFASPRFVVERHSFSHP